jgi:hypothetical protein
LQEGCQQKNAVQFAAGIHIYRLDCTASSKQTVQNEQARSGIAYKFLIFQHA